MDDPDFIMVNKQELYVVLKTAYYTGLRRGDICHLEDNVRKIAHI